MSFSLYHSFSITLSLTLPCRHTASEHRPLIDVGASAAVGDDTANADQEGARQAHPAAAVALREVGVGFVVVVDHAGAVAFTVELHDIVCESADFGGGMSEL